ncbi:hypothetical protein ACXYMU_12645 [Pontibacter sp. CAU 1760]
MKNAMYKLAFVLCLFLTASCSQNVEEETIETETTEATMDQDTSTVSKEVPKSLQAH